MGGGGLYGTAADYLAFERVFLIPAKAGATDNKLIFSMSFPVGLL